MKQLNQAVKFYAFALLVLALTGVSLSAQTAPRPATPAAPKPTVPTNLPAGGKMGLLDTTAFDGKEGLKRYNDAMDAVEAFFKTDLDALRAGTERMAVLEKELAALQQQLQTPVSPTVPINTTQLRTNYTTKSEEYERLGRDLKFKQEDLKVRYQKKQNELVGPVLDDINAALAEYAKKNGYSLVLDLAKFAEKGMLIAVGDEKINFTKDFITFYNARPPKPVTPTAAK